MGNINKLLQEFLDEIKEHEWSKVLDGGDSGHTIVKGSNFRLDFQGMTSDDPPAYNLQIQANSEAPGLSKAQIVRETTGSKLTKSTATYATILVQSPPPTLTAESWKKAFAAVAIPVTAESKKRVSSIGTDGTLDTQYVDPKKGAKSTKGGKKGGKK